MQNNTYQLFINPSDSVLEYYMGYTFHNDGDSGYDLFVPEDVIFDDPKPKFVNFQIKCEMRKIHNDTAKNCSYYLYPRSSISKTPLRLCNSVGIIDAGYRGDIIAALEFPNYNIFSEKFILKKGTKIVQICTPTLDQPFVKITRNLTETSRGDGGFGSTNK